MTLNSAPPGPRDLHLEPAALDRFRDRLSDVLRLDQRDPPRPGQP